MNRFGIHFRLLIAAFLLICATTFTLGYIGAGIIHQFVRSRFDERIEFLAKYLALNCELGILIDDREMLAQLSRNLLSEKDVVRVSILDAEGRMLADIQRDAEGNFPVIETPVLLKDAGEESLAFQWSNGKGEKIIGSVCLHYTTEGINSLLHTMKSRFAWLTIWLSALSLVVFYFISRSLVSPVRHLADAARQVAKGDLGLRVTPSNLPETKELALAFNAMLDSLEESSKALDKANQEMIRQKTLAEMGKFSLMVAHEVKNPLSIIKSSFDMLKRKMGVDSDPILVEYIEDEIRRLNRMIEDFLSFARPASPTIRSVDANAMLKSCLDRFEMQHAGERTTVRSRISEDPCQLNGDTDLLTRAINNILKNAMEAGAEGGTIEVASFCRNGTWIVQIDDAGEGIEEQHLPQIFEPFFTTRAKGTGLGLAFVHQVAQTHSGSVTARNLDRGGARFQMTLPLNKEEPFSQESD